MHMHMCMHMYNIVLYTRDEGGRATGAQDRRGYHKYRICPCGAVRW